MAEQPATVTDNKPKASANGVDKIPWIKTPEGRKRMSDAQKAAHAAKARNTTPVPDGKISRLKELVHGGATVKEAAQLIGMGYSTAQRYMSASKKSGAARKKSSGVQAKKAKGRRGPLSPRQMKLLNRLLPKLGSELKAHEIAKRVGCHLTSVYAHQKKMLAAPSAAPTAVGVSSQQSALSASDYSDLKAVYSKIWRESHTNHSEPSDAELDFTKIWRRIR